LVGLVDDVGVGVENRLIKLLGLGFGRRVGGRGVAVGREI